ncbi:hypothetical protein XENOCAPTIV_000843, partial [Xenoophorus captivus]
SKSPQGLVGLRNLGNTEFLRFLLDGLHNEVNRATIWRKVSVEDIDHLADDEKARRMWNMYLEREDSKVVDLFVGQLKSSLTCTVCGFRSTVFEPFWDLSIPIPQVRRKTTMSTVLSLPAECPVYNLYAVSNHTGNTLGGHYTAYCRNPVLGEWYTYNDSRLTRVLHVVCRVSPMSSSQVRSSNAYVLFYELANSSHGKYQTCRL